ncbi:SRPBCC family protein [Aeromicrobium sp.]|uniref:SRPBCC family protein n=1 Tax=Aeromicrobium sp. TaxID=1871063 RepID=UPI001986965E|nr:SRPBCC family protein [Aeromicrobium sp.]MBC7633659.1 SRPBCC family protein [Aeromicrobium sp.]
MKLSNSFSIDRPSAEVFAAFLDIERVASCMPGSRVTGRPEPDTYEGEVKVKVGPLGVAYTGQFKILEVDHDQLRLTMRAKGRELRGAGNADAHIIAQLSEQQGRTLVAINTELSIRGKVAQFGRGVIGEVTDGIMQTFASNVEQMLAPGGSSAPAETGLPDPSSRDEEEGPAAFDGPPAAATGGDFDVWSLIIRPLLQRHMRSMGTVAAAGLAAYLGARIGVGRKDRYRRN